MSASDIITLGAAIFGLVTSIAGSSACFYNSYRTSKINISILKVKLHNLELLVEGLRLKSNGIDMLNPDPSPWIHQATEFLTGVSVVDLENRLHEKCISGGLPNFFYRCAAEKSIEEKIQELDVLLDTGKQISQAVKIKGSKQPEVNIVGRGRSELQKIIWDQVSQSESSGIVCVHGIAGVGKTVLTAAIHNKALVELTDFENVMWVNLEYASGLRQVQEKLASKLHVDLSGSTDNIERSKKLRSALMQRGKFLLVLDSMWQAFPLQDIGIPEPEGGSKLIVTSRAHSVCRKITRKTKSREIYKIKPLMDAGAWELFTGEVGPYISHLEHETLCMARDVVSNFDGLPLAIKMLAEILSEIHEDYPSRIDATWREELSALIRSTSLLGYKSHELFDYFKGSYENFGEVSMSCFVYCALFPKGYLIEAKELIEYWMWEGLLGEISSLEESMRLGRRTLNELKDCHFLESVNKEGREESLKMLNVVRHVAMDAIAKSDNQFFIKSGSNLSEFPSAYEWPTSTERASFVQNQLCSLKNSPDCKKLSTLLLQHNHLNLNHHENFFSKIRNLRVLDLSHTSISTLPKSFSGLTNLHALLLRSCINLKRLPSLSNLERLIVIDLSRTPLEQLPDGLQYLTNLRRLNLSQTNIEIIPAKVIGKLTQVEELLLIAAENGGYVWGSNQTYSQWRGACVEELVELKKLVVLQVTFLSPEVFNTYVDKMEEQQANQPRSFKFCVGGIYNTDNIGDNSIVAIGDHSIKLPQRTTELYLKMCSQKFFSLKLDGCLQDLTVVDVSDYDALTYLFTLETLGSLRRLKKICVKRCQKMESIIQPAAEAKPTITLPELATFVLFDMPNLKSICHGQVLNCPSLRGFEVWNCKSLRFPGVLLGRNVGIVEIKGEKEWLDKVREDNPGSTSTFKYIEATEPAKLSTPRLRRLESFVSRNVHQNSHKSFGFRSIPRVHSMNRSGDITPPATSAKAAGSSAWNKIYLMIKDGLAFPHSAGSLHIPSSSGDTRTEGSTVPHAGMDLIPQRLNRTSSSRSH